MQGQCSLSYKCYLGLTLSKATNRHVYLSQWRGNLQNWKCYQTVCVITGLWKWNRFTKQSITLSIIRPHLKQSHFFSFSFEGKSGLSQEQSTKDKSYTGGVISTRQAAFICLLTVKINITDLRLSKIWIQLWKTNELVLWDLLFVLCQECNVSELSACFTKKVE